jgi:acetyl esterase/lipase
MRPFKSIRCGVGFLVFAAGVWAGVPDGSAQHPPKTSEQRKKPTWTDVAYAPLSPAQKLDIYLPEQGDGPFPVIVSIHGGAFMAGDKADGQLNPMLEGLKRGFAVVSVNYRLSGEAKFPAQIQDVYAAVRFLRAEADRFRLLPSRFAAWGGSAGGTLAALAGTAGGVRELEDPGLGHPDQSGRVQAVVDWFGPIDFLSMDAQFVKTGLGKPDHNGPDSPESRLLGRAITEIPERVQAANPETYITPDDPPFLIQHGTKDPLIPVEQSILFAARLRKVLGDDRVSLRLLEGSGHGGPAFDAPDNVKEVLDFLETHLR